MAITGINGSNYTSYAAASYKNDSAKTEDSSVTTTIVELKTSTPGVTRTEQIKTGYRKVEDYSKYLQSKYSYMNAGKISIHGIPTTVSVSGAFLEKCMNDPEKAKYLEENLAAIPDCVTIGINGCLGTLTNLSYEFDANGNITIAASGTNDPDGKIARENAERKAKEKKEETEKMREKKAAKKAREKKLAEKIAQDKEAKQTMKIKGKNVADLTKKLANILSASVSTGQTKSSFISFDVMT